MRIITRFLILLGFWLALSGRIGDPYLVGAGILVCALVTYLSIRKRILDEEGHPVHLTLQILRYIPWLLWEILLANIDVAYRVWHPGRIISPQMIRIRYALRTSFATVTFANSITLTPGTITVSVDNENREMLIHTLSEKSAADLISGKMHDQIQRLEGPE